ncbi:MAG: PKD domain-containing protein [Bacteroidota bacterium]
MIIASMCLHAQCITNIDFNSWNQAGYTANGNWVVQGGGSQIHQTVNGNPTFFISPFKLMGVRITGNFKTTDVDDDMMGFVFSFLNPLGQSDIYNGWLFDWKQIAQVNGSYTGQRGKSLCRMDGVIPSSAYVQNFWGHQNTPQFTTVQNDFGGLGWVRNFDHHFELRLSYNRAIIYIDGQLVFDQSDCFLPGYFGFYNYSQKDCYYSNFNFEPYIDFSVLTPQICLGDTAKFQFLNVCQDSSLYDFSTFQSLTWDYGDSTTYVNNNPDINNINPTHIYAQPGTYSVILSVMDYQGCVGLDTQQIVVSPLPSVNFSVTDVCLGVASSFLNQSTISGDSITGTSWQFGEPSSGINDTSSSKDLLHTYSTCIEFNVKLIETSNKGCKDSISKLTTVNCLPTANFNATPVCKGQPTVFNDSSLGNISLLNWNFGDTDTSTTQDPIHNYAACGNFNAKLVVTTDAGCKDSLTKTAIVNCAVIADYSFMDVCLNQPVSFHDSSTISGGTIAGRSWNFGNGTPLNTAVDPIYTYASPGTYSVSLVVTTTNGCKDTITKSVVIHPLPIAQFSVANVCDGTSVLFNNSSGIPLPDTIQSWAWDFGDNTINNNQNTDHLYAAAGSYTVQLLIVSDFGCSDSVSKTAVVHPNPTVSFTADDTAGCAPLCVSFQDSSDIETGNNAQWLWNFGDGSINGNSQNPYHCYTINSSSTSYPVVLTVTSDSGCVSIFSKNNYISVYASPSAQFSTADVCDGTNVQFSYLSTIPANDTIQNIIWNFGDGSSLSNIENTSHLYAAAGIYTVELLVGSNTGCADTVSKIINVNPKPVVNFTANDTVGCEPLCIYFQSSSTPSASISLAWDLGDGSPVNNSQIFEYCYSNDSIYAANYFNVTLTATSDSGCISTLSKNNYITVYPSTNASFTVQPAITSITDPLISITNLSTGANYWNWSFGDTVTSAVVAPFSHTYADTGTYTITLITSTQYNCVDTAYHTVIIEPDFKFYIPSAFTPDGDGINDSFTGKGIFIFDYKMSIFDRWGNLIFFSDNISKPWNGRANRGGDIAEADIYVYVVKVIDFNKKEHNYSGTVTLLR